MNYRKILIIFLIVIFTGIGAVSVYIYLMPTPDEITDNYLSYLKEQDYQGIYKLMTEGNRKNINLNEVEKAYNNFLEEAGIESIKIIDRTLVKKSFFRANMQIKTVLSSSYFGEIDIKYTIPFIKNNLLEWKINWNYEMVYPGFKSEDSFVRKRIIPERGNIYDKNGSPLAVKREIIVIGLQPSRIENRERFVAEVSKILQLRKSVVEKGISRYKDYPDWFVPLKRVTKTRFENMERKLRPIPGIIFRKAEDRVYPEKEVASHIVGYIAEAGQDWLASYPERDYQIGDRVGQNGIEKSLEFALRGKPGYKLYLEKSNADNILILNKPVRRGEDIYLTLDMKHQRAAWEALGDKKGSIVVLNPESGAVLALVSYPGFNPNLFSLGISSKEWNEIKDNKDMPIYNRALQGTYSPGSTFKIITASAALDDDIMTTETDFLDKRKITVNGNFINNYQSVVFEEHKLKDALINSINTTMARVGLKLGKDRLIKYAERYGFNKKNKFIVPVKKSSIGNIHTDIELAWSAVGQAQVVVTPMQMAKVIAVVAADGKNITPYIISKKISFKKDGVVKNIKIPHDTGAYADSQVIKRETAQQLKNILIKVVEDGTGEKADIPGITVAGKTGTAEVNNKDNSHAWFISFAPADKPEIAAAVFCENGGVGGNVSAPITRNFLEAIFEKTNTITK
ncbi:MAG: penicillin-binding transpeptidase domain-containing protein [Halanaerobiales bacterium]